MHVPVLLNQTIALLDLKPSDIVVDATIGFGGHSSEIVSACPGVALYGVDQDPGALAYCAERLGEKATLIPGNFSDLSSLLSPYEITEVNKILIDLGISSYQLDGAGRGFSFMVTEPLDMRMDPTRGITAAEWLYRTPEKMMSDAFYIWGDLIHNRKLVQEIVMRRRKSPIQLTDDLVDAVKKSYYFGSRPNMMKTLSQVFQAIRIAVNDEFGVIQKFLNNELELLAVGGRIAIISFHSGEDRMIKQFFKSKTDVFKPINKKVETATDDELRENSRSKPAKLRVYERIR